MARANNLRDFSHAENQLPTKGMEYLSRTKKECQYMLWGKHRNGCTAQFMSESLNAAGIESKSENTHEIMYLAVYVTQV